LFYAERSTRLLYNNQRPLVCRSAWQTWRPRMRRNNGGFDHAGVGTADQNRRQTDQRLHRRETRERLQEMDEVRVCV